MKELEKDFKRETPTIIGLDEIYLSTPRGIITNIGDRCLVDMLDNRRKVTIVEFLRSLPNPEKIQAASTDMYRPYREAIQEVLPHVVHVVDKYHIIRMGNEALEAVRRRLKRRINKLVFVFWGSQNNCSSTMNANACLVFRKCLAIERYFGRCSG
ncbi:ISL3 family transposase [Azonexus fungiphilus]|uniref:ISL3 family transposase n=1 Tax=Azonexus fungiphilus TaxID=146940 RepID=UPI003CCC58F8